MTVLSVHIISGFVTFSLIRNDRISESALVFPSFFQRGNHNLPFLKKKLEPNLILTMILIFHMAF